VESRSSGDEPEAMKRLTIDVPESLHRAIKAQCAMRGTKDRGRSARASFAEIRKSLKSCNRF